ncbi:uncharacterized protein LOC117652321 [Thrips palmi]|uniref:Uncharacterized protein LOC117652321 n=1 Tax=Thrips palmi TaxID=161013 RepID=A0A6P9A598_THRPL|nr:uncharacterized protein LOC117652321 [Thrips palmi]
MAALDGDRDRCRSSQLAAAGAAGGSRRVTRQSVHENTKHADTPRRLKRRLKQLSRRRRRERIASSVCTARVASMTSTPDGHDRQPAMTTCGRATATCRKCKVHGVLSPMARHRKEGCAFESCDCPGCDIITKSRIEKRIYFKRFMESKARERAAASLSSNQTTSGQAATAATAPAALLQDHSELAVVPVLTLSDDDDDEEHGDGTGRVPQFVVTERTPLGVLNCKLCRRHNAPTHVSGKRCPYANCMCGSKCKAKARLKEIKQRWSMATLAERGLQNPVTPASPEGLHTPDASGTQPGAEERDDNVSVLVSTLAENPPNINLLPRLSVLNIEQCAVRIETVTVSPSEAETEDPTSDAARTDAQTSRISAVSDETAVVKAAGEIIDRIIETSFGETAGEVIGEDAVVETAVETAVETNTFEKTAAQETAPQEASVEETVVQEDAVGVSALDQAMHKLCIECSAPLASDMELQDHVDTVHMRLIPLCRLAHLFGRMHEVIWPCAEEAEIAAGEARAKCV